MSNDNHVEYERKSNQHFAEFHETRETLTTHAASSQLEKCSDIMVDVIEEWGLTKRRKRKNYKKRLRFVRTSTGAVLYDTFSWDTESVFDRKYKEISSHQQIIERMRSACRGQ